MTRLMLVLFTSLGCASAFALPPDFHEVTSNIYRGARPLGGDLRDLADRGVGFVLSLEDDVAIVKAEAELARSLGLKFLNIPLNAGRTPSDADIDRAVDDLKLIGSGKVYVHCQRGKDRTGVVVALYRVFTQKWKPQAAYDEMIRLGFSRKYAKPLEIYYRDRTGY